MNIRKETIIGILMIAAAAALGIAGFLLLPATLTVQVNFSGEATNTMPKALGAADPLCHQRGFQRPLYERRKGDQDAQSGRSHRRTVRHGRHLHF